MEHGRIATTMTSLRLQSSLATRTLDKVYYPSSPYEAMFF